MRHTMLLVITGLAAYAQTGQVPQYNPTGELLLPKDYR